MLNNKATLFQQAGVCAPADHHLPVVIGRVVLMVICKMPVHDIHSCKLVHHTSLPAKV